MTREEAYQFIQLYKKFSELPVKITDYDNGTIELEIYDQAGFPDRHWYEDWTAAEMIEAKGEA